ncbi:MAG: Ig-like domain-containing protein [Chitinophagales bacterium]
MSRILLLCFCTLLISIAQTVTAQQVVSQNDTEIATEDAGAITIDVLNNDTGGSPSCMGNLTITIIDNANNGSGQVVGGNIEYAPTQDFFGMDTIEYQACDCFIGSTNCDQAFIYITIDPVNDEPTAINDTTSTQEDNDVIIDVLNNDNDPEGGTMSIITTGVAPVNGNAIILANGDIQYIPSPNYFGIDSFPYQVCDDGFGSPTSLCDTAWVFITINPVNDIPTVSSPDTTININEGEIICFSVADFMLTVDGDLDTLDYSIFSSTAITNTQLDTATGELCFTGSTFPTEEVVIEICDQGGLCTSFTVNYITNLVNDAPIAVDDNYSINEDESSILDIMSNDSDPELQTLTLELICPPNHGELTTSGNQFIYTPDEDFFGEDTLCYRICDEGMPILCDTAFVYISVNGEVDTIIAVDDNYTVLPNEETALNVYDNDINPDNDAVVISILNGPSNGTFSVNGEEIIYTPDAGFEGYDTLTYQICNTGVTCDIATVIILVTDNQAPEAVNDTISILQDQVITFNPLDNDINPEGDSLTLEILDIPTNGILTINDDGTITYEASLDFIGEEEITYVICDDGIPMFCDTATIVFSVGENEFSPQIPNSFSPNGDGQNDFFAIENIDFYDKASLKIFGRWGDVVFEDEKYQNNFDGTPNRKQWKNIGEKLPEGVYFYSFSYSTVNGDGQKTGYVLIKR